MKKITLVIFLVLSCSSLFAGNEISAKGYDGIDKRIRKAKFFLSKKLSAKQINELAFDGAVIHAKDSATQYIKIPYKNPATPGFIIVKSSKDKSDFARLTIQNYRAKDTTFHNFFPNVKIDKSPQSKTAKIIISNKRGFIEKVTKQGDLNYKMDSIYNVVTFFLSIYSTNAPGMKIYLNVALLFDNMDSLNNQAYHKGVIFQDIIPLSFEPEACMEAEFSNSNVLPAIDLKKMLGVFGNPPDSLKKQ
jgi:hypothetical protein